MREQALILFANDAFYEAFKARALARMDALWSRDALVACAHPGWPPLYGREEVMESWKAIFDSDGVPEDLRCREPRLVPLGPEHAIDRKSTRLNSSHVAISYAVFCLKTKARSGS